MARASVRISTRGLGRVILGPCVPHMATLAVLIISLVDSCIIGVYKASRPNSKVYLGFCLSFGFFVYFCLVLFLHLQPNQFCDLKKKFFFSFVIFKTFTGAKYLKLLLVSNRNRKKRCVCGIFTERKGLIWFLKSQKAPAQSSAWLVDAKAKRHPFNSWR